MREVTKLFKILCWGKSYLNFYTQISTILRSVGLNYLSLKQYHRVQVLLILTTLVVGLMTGIAIGNSEVINCEL